MAYFISVNCLVILSVIIKFYINNFSLTSVSVMNIILVTVILK